MLAVTPTCTHGGIQGSHWFVVGLGLYCMGLCIFTDEGLCMLMAHTVM